MNLREFKELTKNLPDSTEIILNKDSEFINSPLDVLEVGYYISEEERRGEVVSLYSTAEDSGLEEYEWKEIKNRGQVIVLYSK